MAKKIDYSKVEQQLQETLIRMHIEQLTQGKPITSARAEAFYGLDDALRPVHEDPVERLLEEDAIAKDEEAETEKSSEESTDEVELTEEEEPQTTDVMTITPLRRVPAPKRTAPLPKTPTKELYEEPTSDLFLLRRHIFWMKQHGIQDRYEQIGSTQEEIFSFRRKSRLSVEDKLRIQTLLQKALAIRDKLLENQGEVSDDNLIEKEKKRHKTKRFNIREKWIPL